MLYRIDVECDNEGELETVIADGRWKPEVVEEINSKFVQIVTVTDPDTGNEVEVEIRKLDNGGMVGLDGSWLQQFDQNPNSPYDNAVIVVPNDEE